MNPELYGGLSENDKEMMGNKKTPENNKPERQKNTETANGRKVEELTPEQKQQFEATKFEVQGQVFETGEEVMVDGKKWTVISNKPKRLTREEDWDKDPYGGTKKENIGSAELLLASADSGMREFKQVNDNSSKVEKLNTKVKPEVLAQLSDGIH